MKPRSKPPGDKNVIGKNVVKIRKSKGMKQKDLLSKLQVTGSDMSPTSLSQLEGQYRLVRDYELLHVAEALNVNLEDLLHRDSNN